MAALSGMANPAMRWRCALSESSDHHTASFNTVDLVQTYQKPIGYLVITFADLIVLRIPAVFQ